MDSDVSFLVNEECSRCGGPLISIPEHTTTFIESSLDYVVQSVWVCYACGHANSLDSEPRFHF